MYEKQKKVQMMIIQDVLKSGRESRASNCECPVGLPLLFDTILKDKQIPFQRRRQKKKKKQTRF
jgi:hypothetical protein